MTNTFYLPQYYLVFFIELKNLVYTFCYIICKSYFNSMFDAYNWFYNACNTVHKNGNAIRQSVLRIKLLKLLLGVERKKIMFDTEKVRSLNCMEKNQVNRITVYHFSVFYK